MKVSSVTLLLCSAFVLGIVGNYLLSSREGRPTVDGSSLLDTQQIDIVLAPTVPSRVAVADHLESNSRAEDVPVDANWFPASPPPEDAQRASDLTLLPTVITEVPDTLESSAADTLTAAAPNFPIALADDRETSPGVERIPEETTEEFVTPDIVSALTDVPAASSELDVSDTEPVTSEDPETPNIVSVLTETPATSNDLDVADTEPVASEDPETPEIVSVLTDVPATSDGPEVAVIEPVTSEDPETPNTVAVLTDVPATSESVTSVVTEAPNTVAVLSDTPETSSDVSGEGKDQTSVEDTELPEPAVGLADRQQTKDAVGNRNDVAPEGEQGSNTVATEVFRERYPIGSLKVEREVALDDKFNYVNHGQYRHWSPAGALVAEGRLEFGRRTGPWKRVYARNESDAFAHEPFKSFREPFVSTATFRGGRLHGKWTIQDGEDRIVSEIDFVDGARDGRLLHYYPDGEKMREIDFSKGFVDGFLRDFNEDGEVIREHKYADGQYCSTQVESFVSTTKKAETNLLHPRMTITSPDDWWNAKMATYSIEEGEPRRHGLQTVWYDTGQVRFRGAFDRGDAVGEFQWWQENGQLSRKGHYVEGKQHGVWAWWHADGSKSVLGNYDHGTPVGRWLFWKPGGKLDQMRDLSGGGQPAADEAPVDERSLTEPALQEDTPTNSA